MPSVIMSDAELWKELMQNNEKAFSLLFKRYYPVLMNYGKSITTHHYMVGDCIQDVFADVWNYRMNLQQPGSVKAYLLAGLRKRIARKLERDRIFTNSTGIEQIEFTAYFTVLDRMVIDEELTRQTEYLNTLINQLPPRQKEALYLRYHQHLSIEEIAETLQMNYQSATNLLHRAIKQLRNSWNVENPHFLCLLAFLCISPM